jgi:hypothetical protein
LVKTSLREKKRRVERFLKQWCRDTGLERFVALNKQGTVIYDYVGTPDNIPWPEEDKRYVLMHAHVTLHCHPPGGNPYFSEADLLNINSMRGPEGRLVGDSEYTLVWRKSHAGIMTAEGRRAVLDMYQAWNNTLHEFARKYGLKPGDSLPYECYDEAFARTAALCGCEYKRIRQTKRDGF